MVKLPEGVPGPAPDARPTGPDPRQLGIANVGAAEQAEVFSAQAGVKELADELYKTGERITSQQEGFKRLEATDLFENEAKKRALELIEKGDLSDPMVARQFSLDLMNLQKEITDKHPGRDGSKLQLSSQLQEIRNSNALYIASKGTEASIKKTDFVVGQKMNDGALTVFTDPSQFDAVNDKFAFDLKTMGLSPDRYNAYISAHIAETSSAAISNLVLAADFQNDDGTLGKSGEAAFAIISDPRISKSLGEQRRVNIFNMMMNRRNGDTEIIKDAKFSHPGDPAAQRQFVIDSKSKQDDGIIQAAKFAFPDNPDKQRKFVADVKMHPSRGETSAKSKIGELDAIRVDRLRTEAESAQAENNLVQEYVGLLNSGGFEPGAAGNYKLGLAKWAEIFGAPDELKAAIGSAAVGENLDVISNKLVASAAEQMGRKGATRAEIDLFRKYMPELTKTREGSILLAEIVNRTTNRAVDMARATGALFSKNDGSLTGEAGDYFDVRKEVLNRHPIFDAELKKQISNLVGETPPAKTIPEAITRLKPVPKEVRGKFIDPPGWNIIGIDEKANGGEGVAEIMEPLSKRKMFMPLWRLKKTTDKEDGNK